MMIMWLNSRNSGMQDNPRDIFEMKISIKTRPEKNLSVPVWFSGFDKNERYQYIVIFVSSC